MSVQYKSADGWKNISSSSNNAVDTVENGNMNPVTSNAVYDALPIFEQYILPPMTYTIASDAILDLETVIPWTDDIIVIPRWLGTNQAVMSNYYNSNGKVMITLKNNLNSTITITDARIHLSVIRSKVNWQL